jgi:hypothetical protein
MKGGKWHQLLHDLVGTGRPILTNPRLPWKPDIVVNGFL